MDYASNESIHRKLDINQQKPVAGIVEIVADLEGQQPEELTPAYNQLGDTLNYIFSNPPVPEAQVEITFSYEGYRITVKQNGSAQFVKTA